MSQDVLIFLIPCIAIIAFLYSSVGHAGASGYIAVMALFSVDPDIIKPTALTLNIFVAILTAWQFWRAGYFSWRLFYPFGLMSIPAAFLGGYLNLPAALFKGLVGLVLIFSAIWFWVHPQDIKNPSPPSIPIALGVGSGLGLLAGLTGTGGGIFLTPLTIINRWAYVKTASAISAVFILFNSLAGLLGTISSTQQFSLAYVLPLVGAIAGGALGSYLGSQRFSAPMIKRLLSFVLIIAGIKYLGSIF